MNIYGVRGYPTPDYTDERHCRTFSIPNTTIALAVFMGALWTLADEANWQAYGDMSPAEAAEAFQDVIWRAYADDEGICPVIEAPYWDTYDNADDQEPEGEPESWYGELVPVASFRVESLLDDDLTWRENLAIWATAGFIAYSGQIGAAIAFIPFARRFVLKFRGNPLGAIAEIFIDGARLATLDTASAEDRIKAIDIILPDDEDDHEIWVAVGEDSPEGSTLQVVRKELDEQEVYPSSLRYNPDTDTVQYSPDAGETWVDDPEDDPRVGTKFLTPLKTGIDIRCRSAASMVQWIRQFIDYEAGVLSSGATILAIASAALRVFDELVPYAILFNILVDVAGTLFGIGGTALSTAFDEDTYDLLLCIFYCNIENDGAVTDDEFAQIQTDIAAQLNTTAAIVMALILGAQGRVGLQNAGTLYEVEDADCSGCECAWCYTFDFELTDGGFTAPPIAGFTYGHWVSGTGWVSDAPSAGEALYLTLDGIDVPHLTSFVSHTDFNFTCGAGVGSGNYADIRLAGVIQHSVNDTFSSPGGDHPISFTGDYHIDQILFNPSGTLSPCVITLKSLTLRGTGDNPFGADNC